MPIYDDSGIYIDEYTSSSPKPKRDHSMFSVSARDCIDGRKEEFDYWCSTPAGRRAWEIINERNGHVTTSDMIDYYLDHQGDNYQKQETMKLEAKAEKKNGLKDKLKAAEDKGKSSQFPPKFPPRRPPRTR